MSSPRGLTLTPEQLNARKAAIRPTTREQDYGRIKNTAIVGSFSSTVGAARTSGAITGPVLKGLGTLASKGSPGTIRQGVGKVLVGSSKVVRFGGPKGFAIGAGLYLLGKTLEGSASKEYDKMVKDEEADQKPNRAFPPDKYKYNLPPHSWSLPVRPHDMGGSRDTHSFVDNNHPGNFHRLRRGVIWHWDNGNYISRTDEKGNVVRAGSKSIVDAINEKLTPQNLKKVGGKATGGTDNNYHYGFQFLWNPETISSSISRNMDVTPTSADRFRSVAGAFPGQETYQFQILLDRVNDFACIRAAANSAELRLRKQEDRRTRYTSINLAPEFLKYYSTALGDIDIKMVEDLARFGTMADLEYLFKALNGDGSNQDKGEWRTLLGKRTANIGFLSPSLMAFRFGPSSTNNLSFVGWITNLSINHTFFTEDMIPLRTTVSFSCDAFAGSTII